MRLRIETTAPLPRLKTWLNIRTDFFFFGTRTFNDLCRRLATDFGLPSDIQLQHAGFDLYGKDPIESVLKEDDLVQYAQILRLKAYFSVILRAPLITEEKTEEVASKANKSVEKRKRTGNESESEKSSPGKRTESPDIKHRRAPSVSSTSSSEESSSDEESVNLPALGRKPELHSSDSDSNVESNEDSEQDIGRGIEEGAKPPKKRTNVPKANVFPTQTLDSGSETSSTSSTSSSDASSDSESDSSDSCIHPPLNLVASKMAAFKTAARTAVPPGQGSKSTHRRNQRKAMARRLQSLIQQGILPEGSTFVELTEYDNNGVYGNGIMDEVEENVDVTMALEAAPVNKLPIMPGVANQIDVAAMQQYTQSEIRGSEIAVPDTEHEASTPVQPTQAQGPTRTLVPRKLSAKAPKPFPIFKQPLKTPDTIAKLDKVEDATVPEDPLITGFYEQVRFATEHRKALAQQPPIINGNLKSKHTTFTVRAFECEPEWCGLADPPTSNGEEVDSVEIDPPSLPFIDTYRHRKKNPNTPRKHPKQPLATTPAAHEVCDGWSEGEILSLVKMEKPRVGAEIYFKSVFLHSSRMEPVVSWRCGKIVEIKGKDVDVHLYGRALDDRDDEEEELEEGEVKGVDTETFTWSELLDVRLR